MQNVQELYDSAISLATAFDQNFVDLAATLRQLLDLDPDRYRDFVKASGVGTRKAYYLVSIDRTFGKLKVPKAKLTELGWTKLIALQAHVTKSNHKELLAFAKEHTVAELKQHLKGGDVEENAHSVLMYFSPADYDRLVATLMKHGAVKSGRGLLDKEKALMKLVELASQKKK